MCESETRGLVTTPSREARLTLLGFLGTISILVVWIMVFSRAGALASLLGPLAPALCST